jgi:hypothetical protein
MKGYAPIFRIITLKSWDTALLWVLPMTGRILDHALSPSRTGLPEGESAPIRRRSAFHASPLKKRQFCTTLTLQLRFPIRMYS